jgi:uncharacterized protein
MGYAALAAPFAILVVAGGCKEAPPPESAVCLGVPQMVLSGRVADAADILTDAQEARLSERLARYEDRTKHQMVIATTPGLNGATPLEFATCLGRRWAIGRAEQDDGIVILVASDERQMSIALGLGMEKMFSDPKAKDSIDQATPYFRKGDYAGGLSAAVERLAGQTGEPQ